MLPHRLLGNRSWHVNLLLRSKRSPVGNFQQPDNLQTDSNFGLISATVANPDSTTSARQMQVALKLNF
jgi:hypothetical protein